MIHTARDFIIVELVPPQVYQDRGEKAWELVDARVVITLDQLRERFGPITVNNLLSGGNRMRSGLRTKGCPYGTEYSQHQFGRAADCLFSKVTTEKVRQSIFYSPDDFPFINSVELGTSWLHFDVRNCNRIKTYTP